MGLLGGLLWGVAGVWALALVQLLLNRLLVPDLARVEPATDGEWPPVSILAPARDEEEGVEAAVRSFCAQDYPRLEVVVVDDRSTDRTPEILGRLERELESLRVVRGEEPPPGWLGKPWALETGRRAARGEWLLVVDADVQLAPGLLRRAVTRARRDGAGLTALAPRIVTGGVVEAAIMSHLALLAGAIYPTFLVSRSRARWLALGTGAGNLVHRTALDACGAFASLRDEVVDDVGLGLKVKAAGFRVTVAGASDFVRVRMYPGAAATVRGFTKNLYPGLFRRVGGWSMPVAAAVGFALSVLPYAGLGLALAGWPVLAPAAAAAGLCHLVHGLVALFFRMPWTVALTAPVREVAWWVILARSYLHYRRSGVVWRGRSYHHRSPVPDRRSPGEG